MLQLSMINTELGPGYGFIRSSVSSMNVRNVSAVKDPFTTVNDSIPVKDRDGRIEYLRRT